MINVETKCKLEYHDEDILQIYIYLCTKLQRRRQLCTPRRCTNLQLQPKEQRQKKAGDLHISHDTTTTKTPQHHSQHYTYIPQNGSNAINSPEQLIPTLASCCWCHVAGTRSLASYHQNPHTSIPMLSSRCYHHDATIMTLPSQCYHHNATIPMLLSHDATIRVPLQQATYLRNENGTILCFRLAFSSY